MWLVLASRGKKKPNTKRNSMENGRTEPEHRDGRLLDLLDALLDLLLGLAHAQLVLLRELGIAPALLWGLGLS